MNVDYELIQAARQLMEKRYVEGKHHMGCALRSKSGNIYLGIHVEASVGRISLCSESVAIGTAVTAGDAEIEQIVAVTESGDIVPPCGMCRELIYDHGQNATVILSGPQGPYIVPIKELLPNRYESSKYPHRRKG